jgi:hypothetical protein
VHRIAEVEDFQPVEKLIQKREKGISIPETQPARTTLMLLRNKNILYISYFDPLQNSLMLLYCISRTTRLFSWKSCGKDFKGH